MWMLMDTGKSGDKKQTYLSAKALDEYVCAEDMYRNLETIEYSEHMGSGDGVSSTSAPARSFTYVVPGTAGERLMNYACSYTKPEKKKPLPKDKSGKSAAEQLFGDLPPLPWPAPKAKAKSEPATEI
jgi:hypothetical protein